jgi:hypothetical protein
MSFDSCREDIREEYPCDCGGSVAKNLDADYLETASACPCCNTPLIECSNRVVKMELANKTQDLMHKRNLCLLASANCSRSMSKIWRNHSDLLYQMAMQALERNDSK